MRLPKVLIHCQYVYGLGHLIRALQLAEGLVEDFEVYFLSGGIPVKGITVHSSINFIQLHALYKEEDSQELSNFVNDVSIDECLKNRELVITKLITEIRPDIIITEHFPFGFLFEQEVLNLISHGRSVNDQVKIVSSVRDIIESAKANESDRKSISILNEHYDLLLVHGDENLIPFNTSFSLNDNIKIRQVGTGYIIDNSLKRNPKRKKTIVVSIGGGRMGKELKSAVVEAFKNIKVQIKHDLIVFDGAFNQDVCNGNSEDRIKYMKFDRKLFLKELSQSDISISLGGYNTITESLYLGNKILVYNRKFLGQNFEQEVRISSLAKLGYIKKLNVKQLSVNELSKILLQAINSRSNYFGDDVDFNGVSQSVQEIRKLIHV